MNFSTETSPDTQLILDELRKLSAMQSELFADLAVCISRVAAPSAAAISRVAAPSTAAVSPMPVPLIVADNWGGLFDGGDDPDEQQPEAPIVADSWGGIFEQPTHILDERECIEQIHVESCLASTDSNVIFAELASTDQICVEGAYTFPDLDAPVCFTPAPNVSDAATSSTKEKDPVEVFEAEYQIQKLEKLPSSTTGKAAATVAGPRRFPPRPPRPRQRRRAPSLPLRLRRPRRPPWLCRPLSPRTCGPRRAPPWRGRPLHRMIWRPPWRLASFNRRPRRHGHRVRGYSLRPGQRRRPPRLQGRGRRPRPRARALLPHPGPVRHPVRTPPHRQRGRARRILRDAACRQSRPEPSRRLPVQAGLPRRFVHAQHQLGCHQHVVYLNLPQGPPWRLHNRGVPAAISIHAQVVLDEMQQRYNTNLTSVPWMDVDLSGSSATTTVDDQKVFEELSAQNLVQLVILDDNVYTVPVHLTISQPTILWESLGCIQEYMSTFTVACLVVGLEGMDPCRNQHGLRGALNLLRPMYLCDGLAWWQRIRAAKTVLDTNLDIAGHMASVYAVGCPCFVGATSIDMTGILCEAPQHHGDSSGYDMISVILLDKQLADLGCVGVPCSEAYNSVLHLSFSDQSFVAQVDLFRLEPWDPGGKQLLLFVDTAVCVMILWHVQRKCGANCRCFLLEVTGRKSRFAGGKADGAHLVVAVILLVTSRIVRGYFMHLSGSLTQGQSVQMKSGIDISFITVHFRPIPLPFFFGSAAPVHLKTSLSVPPMLVIPNQLYFGFWSLVCLGCVLMQYKLPWPPPQSNRTWLQLSVSCMIRCSLRQSAATFFPCVRCQDCWKLWLEFHQNAVQVAELNNIKLSCTCSSVYMIQLFPGKLQALTIIIRHLVNDKRHMLLLSVGQWGMILSLAYMLKREFLVEDEHLVVTVTSNMQPLFQFCPLAVAGIHADGVSATLMGTSIFQITIVRSFCHLLAWVALMDGQADFIVSYHYVHTCWDRNSLSTIIYDKCLVAASLLRTNSIALKKRHGQQPCYVILHDAPTAEAKEFLQLLSSMGFKISVLIQIRCLQFPWDPGGPVLLHRLGGKPKLKEEGMSATTHSWAVIWALGLGPVECCLDYNCTSATRAQEQQRGRASINQTIINRKIANSR